MKVKTDDLVVQEVRKRREQLMKQYGYDVKRIVKMIKEREKEHKNNLVDTTIKLTKKNFRIRSCNLPAEI